MYLLINKLNRFIFIISLALLSFSISNINANNDVSLANHERSGARSNSVPANQARSAVINRGAATNGRVNTNEGQRNYYGGEVYNNYYGGGVYPDYSDVYPNYYGADYYTPSYGADYYTPSYSEEYYYNPDAGGYQVYYAPNNSNNNVEEEFFYPNNGGY